MPGIARNGDIGSSHGARPATPAIKGSPDVNINGREALRQGDPFEGHGCDVEARKIAEGSATVFINNRPAARLGDAINCGGALETASSDVNVDEAGG